MTPPPPGCETDCSLCKEIPPLTPIFSWKFTDDEGDYQTAFEIWLTDKDGNIIKINSSERNGGSQNYAVENGLLQYSNSYQWKIRVADSGGIYSDWVSFDGGIYNTPIGSFPTPNFDFSPENPQLGKEVNFTDKSTASDGAEILNWEWSFPNASLSNKKTAENPLVLTYNQETNINPEVIFYVKDKDQKVTLRVVDTNGLSCSVEKFLNITNVLPRWREIIPW
jgi:PKD repeat protein